MGLIQARRLDRRVTLLVQGAAVDDGFTLVPGAWETLAERSASIKPRMGREPVGSGSRAGEAVQSVWLRWDEVTSTLTEQHAVLIGGTHYEIIAPPIEVGRREGIELLVVAGGPAE